MSDNLYFYNKRGLCACFVGFVFSGCFIRRAADLNGMCCLDNTSSSV